MKPLNIFLLTPTQNCVTLNPMLGSGICLVGTLLAEKHHVRVCDNNGRIRRHSTSSLLNLLGEKNIDLLGLSVHIHNAAKAYKFVQAAHRECPKLLVIGGGLHAYVCADEMLELGRFDIVFDGEAEEPVVRVTDLLAQHSEWLERPLKPELCDELEKIPGLRFKRAPLLPSIFTGASRRVQNLDELPLIDFSLLNLEDWIPPGKPDHAGVLGMITTQRGCPYGCSFCKADFMSGKIRANSADYIVEWIADIARKYGTDNFMFADNNFTIPRQRVPELCKKLQETGLSERLSFRCCTNVLSPLTEDLLKVMKEANFQSVQFGLERLTESGMQEINKRVSDDKVATQVKAIPEAGLRLYTNMLVGFPFESEESLAAEREAFARHSEYIYAYQVFVVNPIPGTTLYDDCPEAKQWYLRPEYHEYPPTFFSLYYNDVGSALTLNHFKLSWRVRKEIVSMMRELAIDNNVRRINSLTYQMLAAVAAVLANVSYCVAKVHPRLEHTLFAPVKKLFFRLQKKAVRRFYANSEPPTQSAQKQTNTILNVDISEHERSKDAAGPSREVPLDVID